MSEDTLSDREELDLLQDAPVVAWSSATTAMSR